MDTRKQANALNIEDELKKLREKSDRGELLELKRGPFGSYSGKSVSQYVSRLKEQLQTSERTFKSRISELSAEKDSLKAERDALQARLASQESGVRAGSAGQGTGAIEEELRQAEKRSAGLQEEKDALQKRFAEQAGDYGVKAEEYVLRIRELEESLTQDQELAEEYERNLEDMERKLERLTEEGGALKSQIAELRQENCRLNVQAEGRQREAEGLSGQLNVARNNILGLICDKESLENINVQLKDMLSGLVVKAETLARENGIVNSQVEAGRAKMQLYQTMHEQLADTMAKVRAAGCMLEEKILEMDRTLSFGEGQVSAPRPGGSRPAPATKAELLDFAPSNGSVALQDVMDELNAIQAAMIDLHLPVRFDKQPKVTPGGTDGEGYSYIDLVVNEG